MSVANIGSVSASTSNNLYTFILDSSASLAHTFKLNFTLHYFPMNKIECKTTESYDDTEDLLEVIS